MAQLLLLVVTEKPYEQQLTGEITANVHLLR